MIKFCIFKLGKNIGRIRYYIVDYLMYVLYVRDILPVLKAIIRHSAIECFILIIIYLFEKCYNLNSCDMNEIGRKEIFN